MRACAAPTRLRSAWAAALHASQARRPAPLRSAPSRWHPHPPAWRASALAPTPPPACEWLPLSDDARSRASPAPRRPRTAAHWPPAPRLQCPDPAPSIGG
eukprot:scaffold3426_cov355-Prasinococcus_capsulatus_cf.AAC.4